MLYLQEIGAQVLMPILPIAIVSNFLPPSLDPTSKLYSCSLVCYKEHRATCQTTSLHETVEAPTSLPPKQVDDVPLKSLSSLKWPFIPEAPSFQDPLTGNDPPPLKLSQFEAIGMLRHERPKLLQ